MCLFVALGLEYQLMIYQGFLFRIYIGIGAEVLFPNVSLWHMYYLSSLVYAKLLFVCPNLMIFLLDSFLIVFVPTNLYY